MQAIWSVPLICILRLDTVFYKCLLLFMNVFILIMIVYLSVTLWQVQPCVCWLLLSNYLSLERLLVDTIHVLPAVVE